MLTYTLILVEYVPDWFPGASWKRKARVWREDCEAMCDVPFKMAKERAVRI